MVFSVRFTNITNFNFYLVILYYYYIDVTYNKKQPNAFVTNICPSLIYIIIQLQPVKFYASPRLGV